DTLGHHFTVLEVRDRRIRRLRGVPRPPEEPKPEERAAALDINERSFILVSAVRGRKPDKQCPIRLTSMDRTVAGGLEAPTRDGLSMHKLARAGGIRAATIYIYFKSRDDLIVTLYREEAARMAEFTLAGFDPAMPFADGLRVQWTNRARYFIENPKRMHFMEQI